MPELPEVEAARRRTEVALVGHRIVSVAASEDRIVFGGRSPRRVAAALRGRHVHAVRRKGKHLWLELDRRPWLALHFGMSGRLHVYDTPSQRPRFWKLELVADSGIRLAYTDTRRFGRVRLQQDPAGERPIRDLGFDPLQSMPTPRELQAMLARRRAAIKAVLLDQSLFAGVGNWVADEVLYQAGISPHRPAVSLTLPELRRLRSRLLSVVHRAVAVDADSDRFPRGWLFHKRWGRYASAQTSRREPIVHHTIAGRTTAWVPRRQR